LPYLAAGAILKGENYWEMLPELAERGRSVKFIFSVEEGQNIDCWTLH
jgi:hypothetical protein